VRRSGKTVLAKSLGAEVFLNCDLPSSAERLRDPESFFRSIGKGLVVLDEVLQLPDPSQILKIAADAFPELRVLATGSSTLAATHKFRDSLTGRKRAVELVPVLAGGTGRLRRARSRREIASRKIAAGSARSRCRVLHGMAGLLLCEGRAGALSPGEADGVFALRRTGPAAERRIDRGGIARQTRWSDPTDGGVPARGGPGHPRGPIAAALRGGRTAENVGQPKLYGFDTGFVCHARGWDSLRPGDRGLRWEHLVLDTLVSLPVANLSHWRDQQRREIDFVLPGGRGAVDAIECQWNVDAFETRNLAAFRGSYPEGRNYLVSAKIRDR
jgi:hypothetical protein